MLAGIARISPFSPELRRHSWPLISDPLEGQQLGQKETTMSNEAKVVEPGAAIEQLFNFIPGGDALIQHQPGQVIVHYDRHNTGMLRRQAFPSFQDALAYFHGQVQLSA